jgi:RNA polymerase sigma factor (sigma-70 family)
MEDRLQRGLAIEDRLRRQLEELFALHGRDVTEFAYFMTGDPELAQDIAQEAFVRLFGRFGHLRNPEATHAYLRQTVVNLSRSHFRKRRTERAYVQREGSLRAADLDRTTEPDDALWLLQDLPAKQRAALILRYYFDLSEHQTAEVLRVTSKAVNGLVTRALHALRERHRHG